jgi:hypothetical protein
MTSSSTSPSRAFSQRLVAQAKAVMGVLAAAQNRSQCMVTGKQVMAHWAIVGEVPAGIRFSRALEPLLADGAVLAQRDDGLTYYGIAGSNHNRLPEIAARSNLAKVEEALHRAVVRSGGPVPHERVAAEIDGCAELTLDADAHTLGYYLATLERTGRAPVVRPVWAGPRRRYYTVPFGPMTGVVGDDVVMGRRRKAIAQLWKASGGRPFTTAALRDFSESNPDLRIDNDPKMGWTNALQHLEALNEVEGIRDEEERWVRWAPASEWSKLSQLEQIEKLRDDYRVVPERGAAASSVQRGNDRLGLRRDACALDVAYISKNFDMRTVLKIAHVHRLDSAVDPRLHTILDRRPLTVADIAAAAEHFVHLTRAEELTSRLSDASRLRKGMVKGAITRVGRVGRRTFFALEASSDGRALVHSLRVIRSLDRLLRSDAVGRLQQVEMWSAEGVTPVPPALLAYRGRLLRERFTQLLNELDRNRAYAPMLPEESARADHVQGAGLEAKGTANAVEQRAARRSGGDYEFAVPPTDIPADLVEVEEAAVFVAELERYRMANKRELIGRVPTVGIGAEVAQRIEARIRQGKGRRSETALDRVGFALYAATRWGGATWKNVSAAAINCMGEVRNAEPFIELLERASTDACHGGLLSSLALFDTGAARAAIARYIHRAIEEERRGVRIVPLNALVVAALGLSRKYLLGAASRTNPEEEEALSSLALWRDGDLAARAATLSLRTWESPAAARELFLA